MLTQDKISIRFVTLINDSNSSTNGYLILSIQSMQHNNKIHFFPSYPHRFHDPSMNYYLKIQKVYNIPYLLHPNSNFLNPLLFSPPQNDNKHPSHYNQEEGKKNASTKIPLCYQTPSQKNSFDAEYHNNNYLAAMKFQKKSRFASACTLNPNAKP